MTTKIQNDFNKVKDKVQEIKTIAEGASEALKEVIASMEKVTILFKKLESYCPNDLLNVPEHDCSYVGKKTLFTTEQKYQLREKASLLSNLIHNIIEYRDDQEIEKVLTAKCRETIEEIAKFNDL